MCENRTLEFKSEITNTFLKTVSAFANFNTGAIKFGISDEGGTLGIKNPRQACLDIENKINDSILPKPDYNLSVNSATGVITLTVFEGKNKPYLYKGKAYRRSDTATVETDEIELRRLVLEGSHINFEELAFEGSVPEFSYMEKKMAERLGVSALTKDILKIVGFFSDDGKFNVASALFADKNTFSGIDMARFGNSINEIMERNTVRGVSVLKQFDEAVSFFVRYYQYEKIEGFERTKQELIPEAAFREAIANALVHRTWDIDANIKVAMFRDKIEISSPGGLPCGITRDEYLLGNISRLRNPIMGNLFYRMHYIEMFGTGITRIKQAYAPYAIKPEFEVFDSSIKVTLPIISYSASVTEDEGRILELLRSGRILSAGEIATRLVLNKSKVIRALNALINGNYIIRIGTGRGTKYGIN